MENNGRELDPDPVKAPPAKDGYKSSKELTIMLIGSVGKMRSFKISRKFIWYTSIFFSFYLIISLIVFYLYFDLYTAHSNQADRLKDLKAELSDKTKIIDQNKIYIKGLEDFFNAAQKGVEEKAGTDSAVTAPEPGSPGAKPSGEIKNKEVSKKESDKKADTGLIQKKALEATIPDETKIEETFPKKIEKTADTDARQESPDPGSTEKDIIGESENRDASQKEATKDYLQISDIQIRRTESELTLDFKLVNLLAEQKAAEGFIHIVVMDKNKECPSDWNSAYNKLVDGFPENFEHGQQFLIQRFRPYQRQYLTNPDSELPSFIRILVYDRSGQKILEKELAVTNESKNDQS